MEVNNSIPSKGAAVLMTTALRTSETLMPNPTPLSAGCLQHHAGTWTDLCRLVGRALPLELALLSVGYLEVWVCFISSHL